MNVLVFVMNTVVYIYVFNAFVTLYTGVQMNNSIYGNKILILFMLLRILASSQKVHNGGF